MSTLVSEASHLRVYLDSNILVSASLNEHSGFLRFWRHRNVTPVTSYYAIGEVVRNLRVPSHSERFEGLLARTQIVSDGGVRLVPSHITLVAKDAPILAAAIFAGVDFLATGDKNHFAHLYDTTVSGVQIISPTDFLALHKDRLIV